MFSRMWLSILCLLPVLSLGAEQRVLRYDATAQGRQASSQIAVDDTYSTGTVALSIPASTSSATTGTLILSGIENSAAGFAALLGYDNAVSGLSSTNVQGAIDELAVSGGGGDAFNEIDVPGGTNPVASGQSTLTLAEGAGIAITGDAATDTVTIASTVVVPVGANPTAVVDGTAVNGSAATFMRSDAAPALANPFTPDGDQVIRGNLVLGDVGHSAGIAITGAGQANSLSFGDHVGAFPYIVRAGQSINVNFAGSPGGELVLSNLDGSGSYTGIYALAGINSIGQLRIYGESAPGSIYGTPLANAYLIRNASTVGSGEGASVIIDANGATGEIVFGTNGSRAAAIDGAQNVITEQDLTVHGDTTLGDSSADATTIRGAATLADATSAADALSFGASNDAKLWRQKANGLRTDSKIYSYNVTGSNPNESGVTNFGFLSAANNSNSGIAAIASGNSTFYQPGLYTYRSRGTAHSPSNVMPGDVLGIFQARGYQGGYDDGGLMRFRVISADGSKVSTYLEFQLSDAASGLVRRMAIYPNFIGFYEPRVDVPVSSSISNTIAPDTSYVEWGLLAVNNTTLSNPNISDGVSAGQRLTVVNVSSSYTVTFTDGYNVQIPSSSIFLGPRDSIEFVWSATLGDWICTSYTNN